MVVAGSPAINAGNNANLPADVLDLDGDLNVAESLPVDQRGLPFVRTFGTVDIVHETRDAGIYRLNVAPGKSIPLHVHRVMHEAEMVLGSGMLCQGKPVAPLTVHRWPHGSAHAYHNPTRRTQTILCVDSPPFMPDDEVPVSGEPARIAPES